MKHVNDTDGSQLPDHFFRGLCRACQTVLAALLGGLLPAIAPVLPHMAEDAWQALPYAAPAESVFLVRLCCTLCSSRVPDVKP